jgi:hypothetical protein
MIDTLLETRASNTADQSFNSFWNWIKKSNVLLAL